MIDLLQKLLLDDLEGDLLIIDDSPALASAAAGSLDSSDSRQVLHLAPDRVTTQIKLPALVAPLPPLHEIDTLYIATPERFSQCVAWPGTDAGFSSTPVAVLQMLAQCRDRVARRVFVKIEKQTQSANLQRPDLLALGFYGVDIGQKEQLYFFSLRGYKSVPNWLNAKYWAHPERWNLSDPTDTVE